MAKRRAFQKRKKSKRGVKKKFKDAMLKLRRMSKKQQYEVAAGASNEFIKDLVSYMKKLRNKPHLVKNSKHRKTLKKHRKQLRRLINSRVGVKSKRKILLMKGGFLPLLIPIIMASIGGAATIGAAATQAAIMKS